MLDTATKQAEFLLKDALDELESPKGSVQSGVQKLLRASRMLGDENVSIWCEVQLRNSTGFAISLPLIENLGGFEVACAASDAGRLASSAIEVSHSTADVILCA